ncbi:PREDICTED: uncharacterized protein LOC105456721 isoform X2 [Wasmannia auropunctata]|uniref:uncharacterized protein LOC105456721 isoform X2 n=1 Tax=Wasmannia auropunctata TaxID=64793 RepID=UPI0005EE9E39|nr:PREDICTED: uncharacterized protein LOC105456721 isoform X2 [Wasmannia auropunctata]
MPSIPRTVSPSIIVLLIFECYSGTRGSSIRSLDVPLAVRNGTGPLDLICAYEVDEDENGLVIKWFHEAYQIYQWIPPIPPQDIGIIKGVAEYPDENLKDPYSRSVIRLKTVTIDMTGEYTCAISTFQDEASSSTRMIVYVPESDMTVRTYPFNKTHVNLTCVVTGARPRPYLKLYVEGIESNDRGNDRGSLTDWYKDNPRTSLDVVVEDTLDPAVVECEMSIPETEYKRRERIVYYPSSNRFNYPTDIAL